MATPGPCPGPYNDFFLPILKDKTAGAEIPEEGPAWDTWERAYMREAVGLFLGLPVARNRVGTFNAQAKNVGGRYFNFRKQRGSKVYTLVLKPNTQINAYSTDTTAGGTWGPVTVEKNSVSFCAPRTVKLSEVMAWMANYQALITSLNSSLGDAMTLSGEPEAPGYESIIAVISPDTRRHPVRVLSATNTPLISSDIQPANEVEEVPVENP